MLLLPMLQACADLSGEWDGELACGDSGDLDVGFALDRRGDGWQGDGAMYVECGAEDACEVEFVVNVEAVKGVEEQDIDIKFSECLLDQDASKEYVTCPEFDDAEWDGADQITAELESTSCEMEMKR